MSHLEVVAGKPVGDVCGGQVGSDAITALDTEDLLATSDFGEQIGVREFDAFRWAGGARCVDQSQHVVGLDGPPRGVEIEVGVTAFLELVEADRGICLAVDAYDALDWGCGSAELGQELLFTDDDAAARVTEQVLDLLGRAGVVDREWRCSKVYHRGVDEVEFGSVGEHQRDGIAARDAERGEAGGDAAHPVGIVAPRDAGAVSWCAQRHDFRVGGGGALKCRAQGSWLVGMGHRFRSNCRCGYLRRRRFISR